MDSKDVLISTSGYEEPLAHIISINDTKLTVAFELHSIMLLGSSLQSVNSEYRMINVNTRIVKLLLAGDEKVKGRAFHVACKKIDAAMKKDMLISGKNSVSSITTHGIHVAVLYFLMCKYFKYGDAEVINLNKFSSVIILFNILNKYITDINKADLKTLAEILLQLDEDIYNVGSKLLLINRYEVEHTNDLSYAIWKELYIYKLIRSIPSKTRANYLCPMIDWAIMKFPSKQLFTNDALITKLNFGANINFIRSTSAQQNRLSHDLIIGSMKQYELNEIKSLTDKLVDATKDIDYALDDISIIMFFPNKQQSLYSSINHIIDNPKLDHPIKNILTDIDVLHQVVFQYMFSVLLLARQGIIHNDPHMNNILISTHEPSKVELGLPDGKIISFGKSEIDITLIDFDKAILSHHHHNFFDVIANRINEEIGIVFDTVKSTIVDDYDQIFNCYVMYDIVRFVLILRKLIIDMKENILISTDITEHEEFIDNLIKISTDALHKIYDPNAKFAFSTSEPHASILWLIEIIFKEHIKINKSKSSMDTIVRFVDAKSFISDDAPEFISSKRKYADKLKFHFISEYISSQN